MADTETNIPPFDLALPDQATTELLAERIAAIARPGDVIALFGDLGTGKTVFARAFVRAFGSADEEVPSPTFTLVQQYDFERGTVYHFDLYRLEGRDEIYELGWEDALHDGIVLVEWPDRLGDLLPVGHLGVALSHGEGASARRARLSPGGDWAARLKGAGLGVA